MRNIILFSFLLHSLGGYAQQQVKIDDASVLDHAVAIRKSHGAEAALQAAGITQEQQNLVLTYGELDQWPAGISSDTARQRYAAYIQNYTCYRVADYPEDTVTKVIIMVPARENLHMPEAMRPLCDFYLLVPARALAEVNSGHQRPEISRGPKWKDLPTAKIIKPDDLYATYDMGSDSIGLAALRSRGMSQAEIDAVVFRSTERNWPDGIDSFDERQKLLTKFSKYKAFEGARWDDKVMVIVPVEKNRKMPILMRPYVDLYFVYNASAVVVKRKRKR